MQLIKEKMSWWRFNNVFIPGTSQNAADAISRCIETADMMEITMDMLHIAVVRGGETASMVS